MQSVSLWVPPPRSALSCLSPQGIMALIASQTVYPVMPCSLVSTVLSTNRGKLISPREKRRDRRRRIARQTQVTVITVLGVHLQWKCEVSMFLFPPMSPETICSLLNILLSKARRRFMLSSCERERAQKRAVDGWGGCGSCSPPLSPVLSSLGF